MPPDNSVAKMASSTGLPEQDKGRSISITPPVQKLMEKTCAISLRDPGPGDVSFRWAPSERER